MLIDTTLREGAQQFGTYMDGPTRLEIVRRLVDAGIDEVELGWVGQDGLVDLARQLRPRTGRTRFSVWSPCRETDIRKAASLGLDRVNIGVPASDAHIRQRLNMDRAGLLDMVGQVVSSAVAAGVPYISVGLEDVSRADRDFALSIAETAVQNGAARIRLSDTVGQFTPMEIADLVRFFRQRFPAGETDLAVHCHNDFGMASANAVTALGAGADFADVSVLGIGERSGIAATEEVAVYSTMKEGSHGYQTQGLRELCTLVSHAAGVSIPRTKPVAGADIFACESGIHAHALSKSPDLFEPYDPNAVRAERHLAVGGKSGRAAVANAAADALAGTDATCPDHMLPELVDEVRRLAETLKRPLTPAELKSLILQTHKENSPCVS